MPNKTLQADGQICALYWRLLRSFIVHDSHKVSRSCCARYMNPFVLEEKYTLSNL